MDKEYTPVEIEDLYEDGNQVQPTSAATALALVGILVVVLFLVTPVTGLVPPPGGPEA